MTATQKHDIIPICTTVLSADQPPKEDIMLDQQKITILYCRLSNEDAQEGESNSIANQREYLTRYARDHGYTNLKILVDDGYTGTNFNRPGVQEGFELVKQGLVGCWLCKDLSRFGRDYLTVGPVHRHHLPQLRCSLHCRQRRRGQSAWRRRWIRRNP